MFFANASSPQRVVVREFCNFEVGQNLVASGTWLELWHMCVRFLQSFRVDLSEWKVLKTFRVCGRSMTCYHCRHALHDVDVLRLVPILFGFSGVITMRLKGRSNVAINIVRRYKTKRNCVHGISN